MVKQYLEHSKEILSSDISEFKDSKRTGMGTISLFGYQNRYELKEGLPILTTKKLGWKSIVHELLWFMRGEHNIKYLVDNNVPIWNDNAFQYQLKKQGLEKKITMYSEEWFKRKEEYVQKIKEDPEFAKENGDLGPIYGTQWRHWKAVDEKGNVVEIDQLNDLIQQIKKNPSARRLIVTAWNPYEVPNMALPPCHTMFHLNANEGQMDLQLYQRSCDMFLGVPFNITSYALLTQIIAQQTGLEARRFVHTFGDVHFYCGAGDRAKWYKKNLPELKDSIKSVNNSQNYLGILDWVERGVPPEEKGKEGQDHVTAILYQLSRTPKFLLKMAIANKRFDELTIDDFNLEGYIADPTIRRAMAV